MSNAASVAASLRPEIARNGQPVTLVALDKSEVEVTAIVVDYGYASQVPGWEPEFGDARARRGTVLFMADDFPEEPRQQGEVLLLGQAWRIRGYKSVGGLLPAVGWKLYLAREQAGGRR